MAHDGNSNASTDDNNQDPPIDYNTGIGTLITLAPEIRRQIFLELLKSTTLQVIPLYFVTRPGQNNLSAELRWQWLKHDDRQTDFALRINSHLVGHLEDLGIDKWLIQRHVTRNVILARNLYAHQMHFANLVLTRDRMLLDEVAQASRAAGLPLQVIGYGDPSIGAVADAGYLTHTKLLVVSPTFCHTDFSYEPVLHRIPKLEMIFADCVYLKFDAHAHRFNAQGFWAGILLGQPLAHARLRNAVDYLFPPTYPDGPGPNPLIVRQVILRNEQDSQSVVLDIIIARYARSNRDGQHLQPFIVDCTVHDLLSGIRQHILTPDDMKRYLHVDIQSQDRLRYPPEKMTPEIRQRLNHFYWQVAPTPQTAQNLNTFVQMPYTSTYMARGFSGNMTPFHGLSITSLLRDSQAEGPLT